MLNEGEKIKKVLIKSRFGKKKKSRFGTSCIQVIQLQRSKSLGFKKPGYHFLPLDQSCAQRGRRLALSLVWGWGFLLQL